MTTTATIHPAWCDDHAGFDDGSADWHKSSEIEILGIDLEVFLTTGTFTGDIEVSVRGSGLGDLLTLEQAERLGGALLTLVKAARP